MRTRRGAAIGAVGLALAWAGCVSLKRTSEARFFVLRSLAEVPDAAEARRAGAVVAVLPVRLPSHLERPQLVTQVVPGEVRISEFVRWAEPLEAGATRTVGENLARLLPEYRVVAHPWPSSMPARCRVVVELTSFGPKAGGDVELQGRWALLPVASELPLSARTVSLQRGSLPKGAGSLDPSLAVQTMSALLADVSRQIAEGVRSLPAEISEHGEGRP